jgi:hypothetical protein
MIKHETVFSTSTNDFVDAENAFSKRNCKKKEFTQPWNPKITTFPF